MENERTPERIELTPQTHWRWALRIAFIWSLLMIPSQIAMVTDHPGMEFPLIVLGMVGFYIVFFRGLSTIAGLPWREVIKGNPRPWRLLLAICGFYIVISMAIIEILKVIFAEKVVI